MKSPFPAHDKVFICQLQDRGGKQSRKIRRSLEVAADTLPAD